VADWVESAEAIGKIDELLASVGLQHGRRATPAGTWQGGERKPKGKTSSPGAGKGRALRRPGVVRVPGWDELEWVRAGFSTRAGGRTVVYGGRTLNLGWTQEDDPEVVLENRTRFAAEVAGKSAALIGVRQIHSGLVRVVERGATGELKAEGSDTALTTVGGRLLAVGVADCVPVLVCDRKQKAVAAFHAGWRGTLARIVERGIGRMRLRYGSEPEDLLAAVGPAIGPCCYAVGEEVRFEFESQFAYASELFSEVYDSDPVRDKYPLLFLTARAPGHSNIGPQTHLDLWEANRRQLMDAGLKEDNIWVARECTACTRAGASLKYFSHRGESGFAGRGLGAVGIVD
jgi:hypothetical protein